MRKLAFSYIRMSTAEQLLGDSKRRQVESSKSYAESRGYDFCETIEDLGVSAYRGKNFKEGDLGRFLTAAKENKFDASNTVLLIETFDRFSRDNSFSAFRQLSEFIETGLTLETTMDGQQYSLESMGNNVGQLYAALGALHLSHQESEKKSVRLQAAWAEKRSNAHLKPMSRRIPAWLEINDDYSEIRLSEQPSHIIREIFRLTVEEDMGAISIAKFFNSNPEQYPKFTKSKSRSRGPKNRTLPGWHSSYIKKILNNRAVLGEFQPHRLVNGVKKPEGHVLKDYFPAVIDENLFDQAQAKIRGRRLNGSGRKGKHFSNIFTRLCFCGSCGGTIRYFNKGSSKNGGQYLQCSNSVLSNKCSAAAWRYDEFEEFILREMMELPLEDILIPQNHKQTRIDLLDQITLLSERLSFTEQDHSNTRKLLLEAMRGDDKLRIDGFESDLDNLNKAHTDIVNQLTLRKQELNALDQLTSKDTHSEYVDLYTQLSNCTDKETVIRIRRRLNALLRTLVDRIIVKNNPAAIPEWEILDQSIPRAALQLLESSGYRTNNQKEQYLGTEHGRRQLGKMLREVDMVFKGGTTRVCKPYTKNSLKLVPYRVAKSERSKS